MSHPLMPAGYHHAELDLELGPQIGDLKEPCLGPTERANAPRAQADVDEANAGSCFRNVESDQVPGLK